MCFSNNDWVVLFLRVKIPCNWTITKENIMMNLKRAMIIFLILFVLTAIIPFTAVIQKKKENNSVNSLNTNLNACVYLYSGELTFPAVF